MTRVFKSEAFLSKEYNFTHLNISESFRNALKCLLNVTELLQLHEKLQFN
jgi:hypothetical protein